MKKLNVVAAFVLTCLAFILTNNANGTVISYLTKDLGGGKWEYAYKVANDTLATPIEEFTIFFDFGLYQNLSITSFLSDWDEIITEPQSFLGVYQDGLYDALSLAGGILSGEEASGFSVSFDWLGTGTPGSQSYEVVNPQNFQVLSEGQTISAVPEPATSILLGLGLIGMVILRHKRALLLGKEDWL